MADRIEISKAKVNGTEAYFKDEVARESLTDLKTVVGNNSDEINTLKTKMPSSLAVAFEDVAYLDIGFVFRDSVVYSAEAYQYIGEADFSSLQKEDLSLNSSDFARIDVKFVFQPENRRILMMANTKITGFVWITSIKN